ncbi:unnamed protein product [Amoebophrya sp. A25]|nr:unnamed protein product [Amoebophrya sp. A25]|eukprot:GSA25T00015538001.1
MSATTASSSASSSSSATAEGQSQIKPEMKGDDKKEASSSPAVEESFLKSTKERGDLNQYWFSEKTIKVFIRIIEGHIEKGVAAGGQKPKVALVSCPSLYFSVAAALRQYCIVLDIDEQWRDDPGFVYYDFNMSFADEAEAGELTGHKHDCSLVVIDPPYITEEVWRKYAVCANYLARAAPAPAQLLCTTVFENRQMMQEILNVKPCHFRPSIPNLVYQYCVYVNFEHALLTEANIEIGDDDTWLKEALRAEEEERRRREAAPKSPPIVRRGAGWSKFLDEEEANRDGEDGEQKLEGQVVGG